MRILYRGPLELKKHIKKFQKQIDLLQEEITELESLHDIEKPCRDCGRESTHFCNGEGGCDAHDPGDQWCDKCHESRVIGNTQYSGNKCYWYM